MPLRSALRLAALAALLGAAIVAHYYGVRQTWSDFDQVWLGTRALLARQDPYAAVPKVFPWPLYYPVPTLLLALPFAAVPLSVARVLFGALSAGVCAFSLARYRPHALALLCTGPFVYALQRGQWQPLLVASVLLPSVGWLAVSKPSIGLATFAARPTRIAVLGGAILIALSFLVRPGWVGGWLASVRGGRHLMVPILEPGGVLMLFAFLRWRTPEGRLLGVLACVPQTPTIYEVVTLALIPQTRRRALILAILFNLLYLLTAARDRGHPLVPADVPLHVGVPVNWWPMFLLAYLPALVMVVRRGRAPEVSPDLPQAQQMEHLHHSS